MGPIGFLVDGIDPRIAELGIGEGHELTRIARIGHDFLVTGHAGVEHHFAKDRSRCTKTLTAQHGAIGEDKNSRSGRLAQKRQYRSPHHPARGAGRA